MNTLAELLAALPDDVDPATIAGVTLEAAGDPATPEDCPLAVRVTLAGTPDPDPDELLERAAAVADLVDALALVERAASAVDATRSAADRRQAEAEPAWIAELRQASAAASTLRVAIDRLAATAADHRATADARRERRTITLTP